MDAKPRPVRLRTLLAEYPHTAALRQYPEAYEQRVVSFLDRNV